MNSFASDPDFVPVVVQVDDAAIRVTFSGGLELAPPVSQFPRLQQATPEQRKIWLLIAKDDGIHWPEVDEDISLKGLLAASQPAARISQEGEELLKPQLPVRTSTNAA